MITTPGGTVRGEVGVGVKVDSGNGPGLRFIASRLGAPTRLLFYQLLLSAASLQLPVTSCYQPKLTTAGSWRPAAGSSAFCGLPDVDAPFVVFGDRVDGSNFVHAFIQVRLQGFGEVGSSDGESDEPIDWC